MPLCHYLWYEDWKCAECCQGDRCNYYVTVSILSFGKLHCLPLVYHSLLTQKLSLITVGSFQPNTQQIPCLGLNDSIISSNSNITVNKLLYSIISYLLVSYSYNVGSLLMYLFNFEYLGIIICTTYMR